MAVGSSSIYSCAQVALDVAIKAAVQKKFVTLRMRRQATRNHQLQRKESAASGSTKGGQEQSQRQH